MRKEVKSKLKNNSLPEHFFKEEYGKLISVISRYIGISKIETAEDIVQETFLKAVVNWQTNGIPPNPQAWLYTTAKNIAFNILKKKKRQITFEKLSDTPEKEILDLEQIQITDQIISDSQLKMMFVCCHPSINERYQITLILKVLCGFNLNEIANAFHTSSDTINKRLVRAKKTLKSKNINFEFSDIKDGQLYIIIKTLYLLFNEGYFPSQKEQIIRKELCFEAIRLTNILIENHHVTNKPELHALISMMYLNVSRFESRINAENEIIEIVKQDRNKWNKKLINKGLNHLDIATNTDKISAFHILATISANHCIAATYEDTNWKEILSLYNELLKIEDSPIIRLNRSVAVSQAIGYQTAINELLQLQKISEIDKNYLFHSCLAEYYKQIKDIENAKKRLNKVLLLTQNQKVVKNIKTKLSELVPKI